MPDPRAAVRKALDSGVAARVIRESLGLSRDAFAKLVPLYVPPRVARKRRHARDWSGPRPAATTWSRRCCPASASRSGKPRRRPHQGHVVSVVLGHDKVASSP